MGWFQRTPSSQFYSRISKGEVDIQKCLQPESKEKYLNLLRHTEVKIPFLEYFHQSLSPVVVKNILNVEIVNLELYFIPWRTGIILHMNVKYQLTSLKSVAISGHNL